MKFKILSDKQGIGLDEAIPLMVFIITAAVTIVAFSLINSSTTSSIQVGADLWKQQLEGRDDLLAFVKQETNGKMNAFHLVDYYYNRQKEDELTQIIERFFTEKYSNSWIFIMEDAQNNLVIRQGTDDPSRTQLATIHLPLIPSTADTYLKITLLYVPGDTPTFG